MNPLEITLGASLAAIFIGLAVWVLYRTVNHGERLAAHEAKATYPVYYDPLTIVQKEIAQLSVTVTKGFSTMTQNLDALNAQIAKTVASDTAAASELQSLGTSIQGLQSQVAQLTQQIAGMNGDDAALPALTQQLADAEAKLDSAVSAANAIINPAAAS